MLKFEHGAAFELTGVIKSGGARLVTISGYTKENHFTFKIQTGSGLQTKVLAFRIPEMPIAVLVSSNTSAIGANDIYVNLNLSVAGSPFIHLCKGFLGPNTPIAWPDSPAPTPIQNRGQLITTSSGNPAAGVEVVQSLGSSVWTLLKIVFFTLVTDATVANRQVHLEIVRAGLVLALLPAAAIQTASQTQTYTWAAGLSSIADPIGLTQSMGLPTDIVLIPGSVISSVTTNLQPGDDFSIMRIFNERFLAQ